jgi:hypothetical protein
MKLLASLALLALVSCTTETKTTAGTRDPTYSGGTVSSALVIAARVDVSNRRILEDALVNALRARGAQSTQSYAIYPGALPGADALRENAQKAGQDTIIVSQLKRVREVAQPTASWVDYYQGWAAFDLADVVTDETVVFETTVWETRSGKMIWSASTNTTNPTSGSDFAESLTKELTKGWTNAALLPGKKEGN